MPKGFKVTPLSVGLDPNEVFQVNGEILRRVHPSGNGNARFDRSEDFLLSDEAGDLSEAGLIPKFNREFIRLGDQNYIRVETIDPFIKQPLFCGEQIRDALLLICEINKRLVSRGSNWLITDGHLGNVTFKGSKPVYVDFGSFSHLNHISALSLAMENIPECPGNISNWTEFRAYVETMKCQDRVSGWEDYHTRALPKSVDEIRVESAEQEMLVGWANQLKPGWILDAGAGVGIVARLLAASGFRVVALDKSGEVCSRCHRNAATLDLPITVATMDLTDVWDYCDMLSSSMVIASSVTHHLYRQGFQFERQERLWRLLCNGFLAVEFIDKSDPHISTWEFTYERSMFEKIMEPHWHLIETKSPEMPSRIWYLFERTP